MQIGCKISTLFSCTKIQMQPIQQCPYRVAPPKFSMTPPDKMAIEIVSIIKYALYV